MADIPVPSAPGPNSRPQPERAPGPWVVQRTRDPLPDAPLRLFCFAHAGGGTTMYWPWRSVLAPDVDVRPVLLPGRETRVREDPYRSLDELIDPLCDGLAPYLDRPYAFFGHSFGALVAYEVARRLSAAGRPEPVTLIASGRPAPRLPRWRRRFSDLGDTEFLAEVCALNGTPPQVLQQPGLVRLLLPALRADFEANENYTWRPGPELRCPVSAYTGTDDPAVNRDELLAWREETSGEFTVRVFSGDHFYLADGRPDVLSAVGQDLSRAAAAAGIGAGRVADSLSDSVS
jgi:surfactin synthase thioesterase subunit